MEKKEPLKGLFGDLKKLEVKNKTAVEKFRNKVLNKQLDVEGTLDILFRLLFFGKNWLNKESGCFAELFLTSLGFRKKIEILQQVFKHAEFHNLLKNNFSIELNTYEKTITFKKGDSVLNYQNIFRSLEKINNIRNHLCHKVCFGFGFVKKVYPMQAKGNEREFDEALVLILDAVEKFMENMKP